MTVSLDEWNQACCWFGAKYHPAEGSRRRRRVVVQICSKDLVKKPPLTGKVNAFHATGVNHISCAFEALAAKSNPAATDMSSAANPTSRRLIRQEEA